MARKTQNKAKEQPYRWTSPRLPAVFSLFWGRTHVYKQDSSGIHIYIYIYIYICVCTCMHGCLSVCLSVRLSVCMHACMHVCISVCVCVSMWDKWVYIHTYIYIYIYMCVCVWLNAIDVRFAYTSPKFIAWWATHLGHVKRFWVLRKPALLIICTSCSWARNWMVSA